MFNSLQPHGLQPTRFLCPWDSPGKNTGVGCHFLLQGIFPTQGSNQVSCIGRWILYNGASWKAHKFACLCVCVCVLVAQSCQLFATPWTIVCQTPLSMEFSTQEYWTGLTFVSPGDHPNPGIKPGFPSLLPYSLPSEPPGKPTITYATAAKSLQSCLTLCEPIDGNPPGSPIPGILQARTLEWVAISFSSAWKWKMKVKSLSCVRLLATPWTTAYQAPPSVEFSRQEDWNGVPMPSPIITYTPI